MYCIISFSIIKPYQLVEIETVRNTVVCTETPNRENGSTPKLIPPTIDS